MYVYSQLQQLGKQTYAELFPIKFIFSTGEESSPETFAKIRQIFPTLSLAKTKFRSERRRAVNYIR